MAFNPFHTFRKHQKPMIAALAIFCMIMFVASSGLGKGDIVMQGLELFGVRRKQGAIVATLNGKKIGQGDLAALQFDRDRASGFLISVAQLGAMEKVAKLFQEQQSQQNKDRDRDNLLNSEINQIVFLWNQIYSPVSRFQIPPHLRYQFAQQGLLKVREEKLRMLFAKNPEGVRSMEELAQALTFEVWANDPQRTRKEYYFGGTPDTADLLDFVLWQQQADRLGIVLTETDIIAAVNREGADQGILSGSSLANDERVRLYLSHSSLRGTTPDQLLHSLTEEYRVLLAQEAILGVEGGIRSVRSNTISEMPAAATPREFLDYYRSQRTTLRVAMLPVPVQRFVEQVKDAPSEATLEKLYAQYKAFEPAPDRELPGFKEPRRVRVETVSAKADSAFYKDAARAQALTPAVARQTAPVAATFAGGPLGAAALATWPLAVDSLQTEYEIYRSEARSWIERKIGVSEDLGDRKQLMAAIAGLVIGATPGSQLGAGTLALTGSAAYDLGVARLAGSLLPAGAAPTPLTAIGLPFPYRTTVLPREAVEDALFAKVVNAQAPQLLTKNLTTVATELAKLKSRPDEAKAYIAKAVKEYGLSHHLMPQAKTTYLLNDDPALKPLKEALAEDERGFSLSPPRTVDVANIVLSGPVGIYDPQRFPTNRWELVKEPFLWWRVEDLPARERPFDVVRAQVEAAWRFEKARVLARQEADRIDAEVKKNVAANHSAAEADKVLRQFGAPFELDNVARLQPVEQPLASSAVPYRPYSVSPDLVAYPRADFVDRLMGLKAPGDSLVTRDRPAATYYVAVLQNRVDPTREVTDAAKLDLKSFLELYRNTTERDSLWQLHLMVDRRRAYRQELLKQMRVEAGAKVDEQGNFVLPAGITRASDADSGE